MSSPQMNAWNTNMNMNMNTYKEKEKEKHKNVGASTYVNSSTSGNVGRNQFRGQGGFGRNEKQPPPAVNVNVNVRMSPKQSQWATSGMSLSRGQPSRPGFSPGPGPGPQPGPGRGPLTTTSPKRNNSHGRGHSHSHSHGHGQAETPDQLSNIKKQWNVERDIPSGTVKNNPFVPKQEVQPPSPQLMHQKRQWDTSGVIQRGSVAARAMSMEFEREREREREHSDEGHGPSSSSRLSGSPQMQVQMQIQHRPNRFSQGQGQGHGMSSPYALSPSSLSHQPSKQADRRSFPFDTFGRTHPTAPAAAAAAAAAPPAGTGATNTLRGRFIENPYLSEQPTQPVPSATLTSPRWEPSKEIPAGTVKGRLDKLASPAPTYSTSTRDKDHGFHDDASDDDPWIIPNKKSGPAQVQVFSGNWGEALAVKSAESDDWDSPATDWIKSSESQTTASAEISKAINPKLQREPKSSKPKQRQVKDSKSKPLNLDITDEKKLNEEDTMQDHREADFNIDDPFETTHQRDADILQAARQKIKTQQRKGKPSVDILNVFDTETLADQHGFPAEPFQQDVFQDAFPSSPFGGNSNFDDFSADDRSSLQATKPDTTRPTATENLDKKSNTISYDDDFVDAVETDSADYQTTSVPKITSQPTNYPADRPPSPGYQTTLSTNQPTNYSADRAPSPGYQTTVPPKREESIGETWEDLPPKKQKKGFFNKLFGGGRKNRKSIESASKKQPQYDVNEPPQDYTPRESRHPNSIVATATPAEQRSAPRGNLNVATPAEQQSAPILQTAHEPKLSPKLSPGRSEDDTTISEMTLPTVFKDHAKPVIERTKNVPPILETFEEQEGSTESVHHDDPGFDDYETEDMVEDEVREENFNSKQVADLRPPPPPPPPPRRAMQEKSSGSGIEKAMSESSSHEDYTIPSPPTSSTGGYQSTSSTGGYRSTSPLDTARFNRRVKEFKSSTLRHQNSSSKAVTQDSLEKRVPGFVARHARNKQGKMQSSSDSIPQSAGQPKYSIPQSVHTGKFEKKFPKASKAFQQGKVPHGLSYGSTSNSMNKQGARPIPTISARSAMIEGTGSARSQRTVDSSSVGSDIRVLRTILRRPRRERELVQVKRPKPSFATYDENSITDPMQRAGLRLLSAAIIPIQTEVRRFLAMRRALTRMWGLIVIQSAARRWMARREFLRDMHAIVKVQAIARGNQERSDLIYNHICAIEIQRFVRGYLSTVRVYEDIYKVTMVQSYVRMKLAMEEATNRMALVIQLQAVARGFLVRRRLEYQEACAVAIQANWRCFFARLTYQFDLLDVIIVQSVWRRKMAKEKVKSTRALVHNNAATLLQAKWRSHDCRRNYLQSKAATLIQAKWRSYDCTMNYLHYLADVLIVQSTVRRFLVLKRVRKIRNDAATKIQSVWRGFVCYADYMFSIADIVVIQKVARRWLATQQVKALRFRKQTECAVVLQQYWRKYLNARRIQRAWRLKVFKRDRENAALRIQKRWRCFVDETEFVVMKYEYYAARTIQSYWRRFWCFSNFIIALDCSIQIQSAFRGYRQRADMKAKKSSAALIQCAARSLLAKKKTESMLRSKQISIATTEQSNLENYAAVLIQSNFRAMQGRRLVNAYFEARGIEYAAILIQTNFRAMQARVAVNAYFAARRIQSVIRGHQARTAIHLYVCARRIQSMIRGLQARTAIRLYVCARRVQSVIRGHQARTPIRRYLSARRIQAIWRAKRIHTAYRFYRAALLIQTRYRIMRARRDVLVLRGEYLAATLIQSAWRGFVCYTDYIFTISDVISAQKTARRFLAHKRYSWQIRERILQKEKEQLASTAMQKLCRGFIARQRYWYTLGCTMQIQSWIRGRIIVLRVRREVWALLKLQCFARRCLARQEYLQRKFILMLLRTADQERTTRVAAMVIQQRCRGYLDDRKREDAARVIQRFFLMVKREVDQMVKARKMRKTWRKKMKNRNNQVEDALLEDAWASAVSHNTLSGKPPLLSTSSSQDSGPNENLRANVGRSRDSGFTGSGRRLKAAIQNGDTVPDRKPKLPPRYTDKPSSVVRLNHDDERSEFSGLTASTAITYARPPVARSKRLNPREMDEDLELEEAFIDAEIFSAKERRLTQSNSMPHVGGGALRGSTKLNVITSRGSYV